MPLVELPLKDTIDVFTAARMAAVSAETIRRWCDEGRVPCVKLVGRWRIFRSEFLAWIEESAVIPAVSSTKPTNSTKPTKQLDLFGLEP